MKEPNELASDLTQFTGTEHYYRHWLGKMIYTDGTKYFAEVAGGGAHWLLDIIATEILNLQLKEPFISIELIVTGSYAVLQATDGNEKQLYNKRIAFTTCPEGAWGFYLIDNILLLRSEY